MPKDRDKWRMKLVKMMPRTVIEGCCDQEKAPWHWDRATLNERVVADLDENTIDELLAVLKRNLT
jgi:hypothetical protein